MLWLVFRQGCPGDGISPATVFRRYALATVCPGDSVQYAPGSGILPYVLETVFVRYAEGLVSKKSPCQGQEDFYSAVSGLESWRWRESNPRPNREPESFLHVYPSVSPSPRAWPTAAERRAQSLEFRTRSGTCRALSPNG